MDFDAIRAEMAKNGEANLADLEYVSEETFSELQKEAKQYDDAEALALGTWRGNNLIVNGRVWTWQDTPGSQCGRTRTWQYTAQTGASYRQAGKCPQGYIWWEMSLPG